MSSPSRVAPKPALALPEQDRRRSSYSRSLALDFSSILHLDPRLGQAPESQSDCNHEMAHSRGGGGENEGSPRQDLVGAASAEPVLDPLCLSLASTVGVKEVAPEHAAEVAPAVPGPMGVGGSPLDAVLAAEVLQRVAWGGDRRRGVARLELGGELSGVVVLVRGEGREISLELTLPGGRRAAELPERLMARLAARGLVVRELLVR
jgi:hypothetical protein